MVQHIPEVAGGRRQRRRGHKRGASLYCKLTRCERRVPISLSFNTKTLTEHCVAAIKFISRGLRRRSPEKGGRRQGWGEAAVMMCLEEEGGEEYLR